MNYIKGKYWLIWFKLFSSLFCGFESSSDTCIVHSSETDFTQVCKCIKIKNTIQDPEFLIVPGKVFNHFWDISSRKYFIAFYSVMGTLSHSKFILELILQNENTDLLMVIKWQPILCLQSKIWLTNNNVAFKYKML